MGGDEIIADWLGNLYGNNVVTSSTVTRFASSSKRFKSFDLFNRDDTFACYIGKYDATTATFCANAIILYPITLIKFEYIDIYELACYTSANHVNLNMLGINEY